MKTAKKKRGRPPKHKGERLSKTRAFRVRGKLDERLIAAAAESGRSVSEEIEHRLEMSFVEEDVWQHRRDEIEDALREEIDRRFMEAGIAADDDNTPDDGEKK